MSLRAILIAALSGLYASLAGAGVLYEADFDASTQGWIAFANGPGFPAQPVSWNPAAGNPGGALQHDAPSEGSTSFFLAPSAAVAALHDAVGGWMAYDLSTLKRPGDTFFSSTADIQIGVGGTQRLRLSLFPSDAPLYPAYTSLTVGFTTAYGWQFFDGSTTSAATQAQIDAMLAGASSLIIRAEYWSSATPDTTFLDNVRIGVPLPGTLALFGMGIACVTALRRRRR